MARYKNTRAVAATITSINNELEKIAETQEDHLSRKGDTPNQMETNIDMNSHRIINLAAPETDHEPLRKADIDLAESQVQQYVDDGVESIDNAIQDATVILNNKITQATQQADRAEEEADRSTQEANKAFNEAERAKGYADTFEQSLDGKQQEFDSVIQQAESDVTNLISTSEQELQDAIALTGYNFIGEFEDGGTLESRVDALRFEGEWYRWDGALPKVVPPASTPSAEGGVGSGAWVSVGDAALHQQLASLISEIIVAGGQARYLRESLNVKDFGAVGDGSEDDTAAIQQAIEEADSRGLGVYVPQGTYMVDTLNLPSGTYLHGAGEKTVFKLKAGGSRAVMQNASSGESGIRIERISINGNRSEISNSEGSGDYPWKGAIHFENCKKCLVHDCRIYNVFRYGIQIAGAVWGAEPPYEFAAEDIIVDNCFIWDCGDDGITMHYTHRAIVSNCVLFDMIPDGVSGNSNGIEFDDGCVECVAVNCIAYNCQNGYQIKGHSGRKGAFAVSLTNCLSLDSYGDGIAIRSVGEDWRGGNITLTNCQVYRSALNGVLIRDSEGVTLDNCIIDTCELHGVRIESSVGAKFVGGIYQNCGEDGIRFATAGQAENYYIGGGLEIKNCGQHGIGVGSATNPKTISVDGVFIHNCAELGVMLTGESFSLSSARIFNCAVGIDVSRAQNVSISNTHSYQNSLDGINMTLNAGAASENVIIDGLHCYDNGRSGYRFGVNLNNGKTAIKNSYAYGNADGGLRFSNSSFVNGALTLDGVESFDNDGDGFFFSRIEDVDLVNCVARENELNGFYLERRNNGFNLSGCRSFLNGNNGIWVHNPADSAEDVSIVGCKVHSNNQSGENFDNIRISSSTSKMFISNNHVRKGREANKPVVGLALNAASVSDTVVFGNDLRDAGESDSFVDSGTGTVDESNFV